MTIELWQNDLQKYARQVAKIDLLTPEEEQRLAMRYYDNGDVEAARRLVMANLRFALKIALEYRRWAPLMDLVQEANLGLIEAVRRFDPYRGYRLITYAVWWIRAYVQKYIVEQQSLVRRGTTRAQRKAMRQLGATRSALEQELGDEVGATQLAEALDVPEAAIVAATQGDLSLDAPQTSDADRDWIETLAGMDVGPEEALVAAEEHAQIKQALEDVLATLNEREREILNLRLLSEAPVTLQELAEKFAVSRERVRQIEAGVRKKLSAAAGAIKNPPALPAGKT